MAKTNVGVPQGTRDFGPDVIRKRNYIFDIIRNVFELYGFQPLETPAMENIETLMGKYGEEGDKLIFRVLESGIPFKRGFIEVFLTGLKEYLKDETKKLEYYNKYGENFNLSQVSTDLEKADLGLIGFYFETILSNTEAIKKYVPKLKALISEKALKYDLTIPFARYVAMNHNQLTFPFKRYQIQPVWRADRPQKGRYREFYQCDADVVGSKSLLNEVELASIYQEVFIQLGITNYELRINSRKILAALAEMSGGSNRMIDITIAIDKLDKIGLEKVKEELIQKGLNNDQIAIVQEYLSIVNYSGPTEDLINNIMLEKLKEFFINNKTGIDGIAEIEFILKYITHNWPNNNIVVDPTLARGLNYYTGIIFEAKAPAEVKIGSIGGGGRYDDLTGLFGVPDIPGVGISFGVDRIYDVMEELKLFPDELNISTQVLFFNLGEEESKTAFNLMQQLRSKGIRCELYLENTKFDKQFKYAEKKSIPYVVIIGSKEMEDKYCVIKDLRSGEQKTVSQIDLPDYKFLSHKI